MSSLSGSLLVTSRDQSKLRLDAVGKIARDHLRHVGAGEARGDRQDLAELDAAEQRRVLEELRGIERRRPSPCRARSRPAAASAASLPDTGPMNLREPEQAHLRRGERAQRVALRPRSAPPPNASCCADVSLRKICPAFCAARSRASCRNPGTRPRRRSPAAPSSFWIGLMPTCGRLDLRIEVGRRRAVASARRVEDVSVLRRQPRVALVGGVARRVGDDRAARRARAASARPARRCTRRALRPPSSHRPACRRTAAASRSVTVLPAMSVATISNGTSASLPGRERHHRPEQHARRRARRRA